MLNRLSTWPASKRIAAAAISLILFSVVTTIFLLSKKTDVVNFQNPVIKFEYCESESKDVCILSFERGGPQNSFINFFVADRKSPDFYLIVKNQGMENRYECARSLKIKTNVACSGPPLSLKQTIEITVFASEDDRLLATGVFFIEALLVSTSDPLPTDTTNIKTEPSPTLEPTEISTSETPTPSETPTDEGTPTETTDL